jgi:signal transduction histidine kinase
MITKLLFDIRIIIRKTLLYSVLSAVLGSAYVGIVTLLARLVEGHSIVPTLSPTEVFRWFGESLKISFAYSCVATSLFSLTLGLFVWIKGFHKPVNRMWALTCLSISVWGLGLGMLVRAPDWNNAYLWERWVQYPGAIMIPILFLHFVMLAFEMRSKPVLWFGYGMAVILQIINAAGLLVSIKSQPPFTYYTLALGPYWIFVANFFILVLYAHGLLLTKMFSPEARAKNQSRYIFMAMIIGFCGGGTSFFPVFNIPVFPYGVYATPIYVFIVTYTIYKHQLMDINVAIRKTLLYSLISAALAAVFVGVITLLAHFLEVPNRPTSAYSSALAAIFITLLFNPLRTRTQRWVDRYFPRERLDPGLLQEAAGGFAHEMKRPLSKISLPAEMALLDLQRVKSGDVSWEEALPKVEEKLRYIMGQSIDAGYMIEAVRELSAASVAPFIPVNAAEVVKTALRVEKDLLERRGVSVHLDLPDHRAMVSGRAKQLEIVFVNLIKNAVEAMSELSQGNPRELRIACAFSAGKCVLRIRDTGPGIKSEDQQNIFRPHYSTKGANGTGMGLYLSEQIILAHGGTIDVQSQPGQGTEFVVRLALTS